MSGVLLQHYFDRLGGEQPWRWRGRVIESIGQTVESQGPVSSVGECCEIVDQQGTRHPAEVIGFRGTNVLSMPLHSCDGIRFGDAVFGRGGKAFVAASEGLIGQIIDGAGKPLSGTLKRAASRSMRLEGILTNPLEREPIRRPLSTGVRTLDGLLTVGRGQRVGIFGGSGVGKSTLIGIMTRNTEADVTVVGLVGERGREVREFVEEALGREGRARSVVVVSTSDDSPLMRLRGAMTATAVAEYFAAKGKNVLLVIDSLTRFAMAAREIGLAAGEPATSKGYTPSVFSRLAKLVERAGNFTSGCITAFYTVLMEGDDQQDPIADAVRSMLDGHIVLSRKLAAEGWYPPIDLLDSISRLMPAVASREQMEDAGLFRRLMSAYAQSEDLVRIGAYKAGADKDLDRALRAHSLMREFMVQGADEHADFKDTLEQLRKLAQEI